MAVSRKRIVAIAVIIGLIVVFALAGLLRCASSDGYKSVSEAAREAGFSGSVDDFYDSLTSEQKAEVDIAFDSSSHGDEDEASWFASNAKARVESDGTLTVVLPDGGEFSVSPSKLKAQDPGSDGSGEGKKAASSGDSQGNEASDSPSDAYYGALLVVDDSTAKPGDTSVPVVVRVEHNPGILGMSMSVSYDDSAMTLADAVQGEAFSDALTLTKGRNFATGTVFAWDAVSISQDQIRDGTILTLYFDIDESASAGQYAVSVTCSDMVDNDLNSIPVGDEAGYVIVG